jgi:SnoaL-like domain
MNQQADTSITPEQADFYARFQSFWSAPTGARVAELIAPDATIHFSGIGTFSGTEYIDVMAGILDSMAEFSLTPLDCAGEGDLLYIFWQASARIGEDMRTWQGVDRMRIATGMAIEEHVIFDSAVLAPGD